MDKKIYIYQIWFPTSNKSYIGQTNNIKRRMDEHLKTGSLVCKALWKYNDWQVAILHTTKNKDLANQLEIEDIRNHKSLVPNGYNLTAGGDGGDTFTNNLNKEIIRRKMQGNQNGKGYKHTVEECRKISEATQGKRSGKNNPFYGRNHSEESRKKISKNHADIKPVTRIKMEITKLLNRITKLE